MNHIDRDTKRLLVEVALAAANQRFHAEAAVIADALDLLISNPLDRAVCAACIHLQAGDAAQAQACMSGRDDEPARLVTRLARELQAAPPRRVVALAVR